jgi:hypothetical protein
MVRSETPESVAVFKRYDIVSEQDLIVSEQDLKEARDRRAHFGHTLGTNVVPLVRQVAKK